MQHTKYAVSVHQVELRVGLYTIRICFSWHSLGTALGGGLKLHLCECTYIVNYICTMCTFVLRTARIRSLQCMAKGQQF